MNDLNSVILEGEIVTEPEKIGAVNGLYESEVFKIRSKRIVTENGIVKTYYTFSFIEIPCNYLEKMISKIEIGKTARIVGKLVNSENGNLRISADDVQIKPYK